MLKTGDLVKLDDNYGACLENSCWVCLYKHTLLLIVKKISANHYCSFEIKKNRYVFINFNKYSAKMIKINYD